MINYMVWTLDQKKKKTDGMTHLQGLITPEWKQPEIEDASHESS